MASAFPEWLAQLASEKKLLVPPQAIVRGRTYSFIVDCEADFSADAFSAQLRASPGATGSALATFAVSVGTFAGGVTPVTFTLDTDDTGSVSIPADSDQDGLTWLVFEILHTPVGKSAYRFAAGEIPVSEAVAL